MAHAAERSTEVVVVRLVEPCRMPEDSSSL
jgi:hypothetical protein